MLCLIEKETRNDAVFVARGLYQSDSYYITYSTGERMIYRYAVINPGQHYNSSTGEYTCPVTGIYLFTYSVYGHAIKDGPTHSRAIASLYRKGAEINRIHFLNNNSEGINISLSGSDILQCSQGDRVWVQNYWGNNRIYGHSVYNMFSGVLLSIS